MVKTASVASMLCFLCIGCTTGGMRDYSKLSFKEITARAFELEARADFVIGFCPRDNRFDIGVGRVDDEGRHPERFAYAQLEHFFQSQKHRDLIVVIFNKNTCTNDEIQSRVVELNRFFFQVGFKRVVIQQGYGSGRGIWSDRTNSAPQASRVF